MIARPALFAALVAVLVSVGVRTSADEPPPKFTQAQIVHFEKDVLPILKEHCFKCHGAEPKIKGGLDLTNRKAILEGGDSGTVYDPKNPEKSLLVTAVHYKDEHCQMPPKGKLPDKDIAVLTKWVKDGLPVSPDRMDSATAAKPKPKGGVVTEEAKRFWAYQPVKRPGHPQNAENPIDAFVKAKLDAKGLKPVGAADRVALVRRAYYDLWGLPPTPEQVDAFVKDARPDAWEKLIDALLASPHYGEKWGRHWLDVVRFAETNGYERDGPKPQAWRYRDYVIKSFNDDKPYSQFIREQIAGDELPGNPPEAVVATGYYRLGVWDDEPADPLLALYDGYDDIVTVAGQGFLGMSLNCARCHDHKVDPIPQTDYYKMVAFFRDIRPFSDTRSTVSSNNLTDITPPERRKVYEAELKARQAKIETLKQKMVAVENEAIKNMPAEDQRASEGPDRPQVVKKVPMFLSAREQADYQAMKKDRELLERKPNPPGQEFALSVNNCDPRPPAVKLLVRGNPHSPGKDVQPGFPEVLGIPDPIIPAPQPGAKSSGRRTVLANWIASPTNPLTARVMVNRVWQGHFGRGIVPTSNDFGKLGELPSHPELLDWLASEFVEPTKPTDSRPWAFAGEAWSLKRLHRVIMTSQTYRMSSAADAENLKADPGNSLLWRFNMRRLNSEEVRDSILSVSGDLNPKAGGPSVYPKIPMEVLAGQSRPGEGWPTSPPEEANRRSVYVFIKRSLQVPVLVAHDQADTDNSCPVRYTTTVPTQALGLLNGEFANERAVAFALRLEREVPTSYEGQVARGIRLTTGRVPSPEEVANDLAFIRAMKQKHQLNDRTALTRYCLLLLNANEFVYLD